MWAYNHTPALRHHGVKGMKWGIRKAIQLEDNIISRKVRKSDLKDITQLLDGLPNQDKKFLTLNQKYPVIKQAIRDGRHCSVATHNGKIVGFMRESGRPNGFVLLEELVVSPEYRNKKIALKMLDEFHNLHPKTMAKIKANNEEMMKILKKNGYEADNPDSKTIINWTREGELTHFGILGMKWGVRRTQTQLSNLNKKDSRWVKKHADKITGKARNKSSKELNKYASELMKDPNAVNKSGKLSAATINAYNKKMASLMNEKVSGLTSPSGKVVQFVAKRGEVGVFMALADQGYNMNLLRNGIYDSGKVAYKNTVVDKVEN